MSTIDLYMDHFGQAWLDLLGALELSNQKVSPRGQGIRELRAVKLEIADARNNVFYSPHRGLQWRFAVAEWLWIWFGRNDVASIKRFNPRIAEMASDDGVIFRGAYGPKVRAQWKRTLDLLREDRDSRQALIQIYETPAVPTKDVPCTLSLQFFIRDRQLETIVNMRSSDIWLGLPYDFFNFSMLALTAAAELDVEPGPLTMHLGSSHLYDRDLSKAQSVLYQAPPKLFRTPALLGEPPAELEYALGNYPVNFAELGGWPWTTYASVLLASTNAEAFTHMMKAVEPWGD